MSQGVAFFNDLDLNAFLALMDQGWVIWSNFHLIFRGNDPRVDGRGAPLDRSLQAYLDLWLENKQLIAPILRRKGDFARSLEPYLKAGLLTEAHAAAAHREFGTKKYQKIYPCPGLGMTRSWRLAPSGPPLGSQQTAASVARALAEALETWGQPLGFEPSV